MARRRSRACVAALDCVSTPASPRSRRHLAPVAVPQRSQSATSAARRRRTANRRRPPTSKSLRVVWATVLACARRRRRARLRPCGTRRARPVSKAVSTRRFLTRTAVARPLTPLSSTNRPANVRWKTRLKLAPQDVYVSLLILPSYLCDFYF